MMKKFAFDLSKTVPKKKPRNIEEYAQNTKIFLEKIHVHETRCTRSTRIIIGKFIKDFRFPEPGEQLRIRMQQQINLISIIMKAVNDYGWIDELTIATYTLNREAQGIIKDLLVAGTLKKVNLFVARSYKHRMPTLCQELTDTYLQLSQKYKVSLVYAELHLKITLFQCGENYFQHEGSLNYSTNDWAEQLFFENNKESYEADYLFLIETLRQHRNKALDIIC